MISKFEDIENKVVASLAPLLALTVTVKVMPETEAEYTDPPIDRPSVIVAFIGSDFDDDPTKAISRSTSSSVQDEFCQIELTLRARKLRGVGGIHWLNTQCRKYVVGAKYPGWSKLLLRRYNFFAFERGVWVYKLVFNTNTLSVEYNATQGEVLTTSITLDQVSIIE